MTTKYQPLIASLVFLILLSGCQTGHIPSDLSNYSYSQTPCWLHTPFSEQAKGVVAITSQYGSANLKELSRRQAIESLAQVYNLDTQNLDELDVSASKVTLSGRTIGLAPTWSFDGQHYSYAYLANPQADRWVLNSCAQPVCQPDRCAPGWMCNDNVGEHLAAVTVSQLSASLREQYRFLFENAIAQLKSTHGVQIEASREQLTTRSGSAHNLSTYRRERSQAEFEFSEMSGTIPLVLTDTCRYEDTIYGRLMMKGVPNPHANLKPIDQKWHLNLAAPGEGMAIGHFSGMLSHNIISLRIEYALRSALVELARTYNVQISSDAINLESMDGGHYYMEYVSEETRLNMRVRVRSVRFTGSSADPEVYVLVEGL